MRNTPRPLRSRGIGTLIGNGWLRESPRDAWRADPHKQWELRSKSSLRKCMFMPVPDEVLRLAPQVSQAALLPQPPARPAPEVVQHRRDPRKDAREFPAYVPGGVIDPRLAAQQAHAQHLQNAFKQAQRRAANDAANHEGAVAWWEDPVALGSLLILVPPIGLAAVWSSKRYSNDARWALTVMTALTMCLVSAVVIAVLALS
jgi:hypothetical protein